MDVTINAEAMTAQAEVLEATVKTVSLRVVSVSITRIDNVPVTPKLSRGGTSLNAVSPDHNLREELALVGV